MSVALLLAALAMLTAVVALLLSVSTSRRLLMVQREVASANAALDEERRATAESIAAAHRATVDEVSTLIQNLLAQVDTDIAVQVAEALARVAPNGAEDRSSS